MELARRLKLARTRKCWTQAEAAQHAGVSKNALSNWERGAARPEAESLRRIAAAYEVEVSYFTEGLVQDRLSLFDGGTPPAPIPAEAPVIRPLPAFPGIRKLLEDPDLCATLGVTAADRELLSSYSGEAGPRTPAEAFSLLQVLRQMSASRI